MIHLQSLGCAILIVDDEKILVHYQKSQLEFRNAFQVCSSLSSSSCSSGMSKISPGASAISIQRVSSMVSGVCGWLLKYRGTVGDPRCPLCQLSECHKITEILAGSFLYDYLISTISLTPILTSFTFPHNVTFGKWTDRLQKQIFLPSLIIIPINVKISILINGSVETNFLKNLFSILTSLMIVPIHPWEPVVLMRTILRCLILIGIRSTSFLTVRNSIV